MGIKTLSDKKLIADDMNGWPNLYWEAYHLVYALLYQL